MKIIDSVIEAYSYHFSSFMEELAVPGAIFLNEIVVHCSEQSSILVKHLKSWSCRASRFPCCVLSYFSLVFVVKHSRRWWLHIGGSKMLAPHFKDEIAGLQKWLFLAGFDLFWCSFLLWPIFMGKPCIFCKKKLSPDVFSRPRGGSKR